MSTPHLLHPPYPMLAPVGDQPGEGVNGDLILWFVIRNMYLVLVLFLDHHS